MGLERSRGLCDVGAGSGVGWSRLSVRVDGGRRHEPRVLIGADEHFPTGVVDESVVESTQEDEVVHVGGATIGPVPDVVQCR